MLVVDDEELIRDLLITVLTQDGYEVTAASDGREAVDLLKRDTFDLVLTDLVMPGVNGVEVLRKPKGIDPQCPVAMITGYPSVETVTRMVRLGAEDYIAKPFNLDVVRITVAKLVEMRRMGQESQERATAAAKAPPGGDSPSRQE